MNMKADSVSRIPTSSPVPFTTSSAGHGVNTSTSSPTPGGPSHPSRPNRRSSPLVLATLAAIAAIRNGPHRRSSIPTNPITITFPFTFTKPRHHQLIPKHPITPRNTRQQPRKQVDIPRDAAVAPRRVKAHCAVEELFGGVGCRAEDAKGCHVYYSGPEVDVEAGSRRIGVGVLLLLLARLLFLLVVGEEFDLGYGGEVFLREGGAGACLSSSSSGCASGWG